MMITKNEFSSVIQNADERYVISPVPLEDLALQCVQGHHRHLWHQMIHPVLAHLGHPDHSVAFDWHNIIIQ